MAKNNTVKDQFLSAKMVYVLGLVVGADCQYLPNNAGVHRQASLDMLYHFAETDLFALEEGVVARFKGKNSFCRPDINATQ